MKGACMTFHGIINVPFSEVIIFREDNLQRKSKEAKVLTLLSKVWLMVRKWILESPAQVIF